ncbi:hypothetical protein COEREDRAFT_80646, partial [Coemansia reversa NRRL 1564]
MSASVVSGTSLKAHGGQGNRTHISAGQSASASPDMDDQNSVDFEEELQQELENEMSASYDNLFTDDQDDGSDLPGETRSATGVSTGVGHESETFSDEDD